MTQKTIKYGIAFDVDTVSLDRIQNQLQKIMNTPSSGMEKGFEKTKQTASEVYQILRQCYNQDLGSLNVEKFNAKLKQSGIGLKELQSLGPNTFNRMGMAMASANVQLNRSNTFINNIVRTMADSAKWSLAYGLINKVSQSITDAISYVKELDTSLNDIRIVTGKSEADMRSFAQEANKAAIALGSSTKAYADASLIYYQQGLGDAEAKERARITTMVANVTGQSASAASEQLTAIWNGYKVNAAEAELYIDKVAKVAAQTGADLEELSTGMSKVASAANIMGVDIDELNAQLATVITVTRQAPESVGTAFKTIYARINAIESGSEDAETTLKSYTKTMLQYGVNVLDMNGKLRDTGDVIAEIGGKWGTMTKEQQLGLAQAMAGQRQYNNLLALFDNWDMYNDALHESQTAMGTLQEQQDVYMDSIAAHAAQAKAQFESLYENLLDKGSINAFYDFTGNIAGTFDKMFSSFGGGLTSLLPVLLAIGSLFSKQIATGAYNLFSTLSKTSPVIENIRSQMALISAGAQGATSASMEVRALATGYQAQLDVLEKMQGVRAGLNEQQQKEIIDGAARLGQLEEELALADSVMQKRAQEMGVEGGVQDVNSIISQEEITASYHSRQMGNSPEDDALGQKIQLRKQELALSEEALKIETQFGNLLGTENQTLQQQEYALNTITNEQKKNLQTAAQTLKIENTETMTARELVTAIKSKIAALRDSKQTTQEELAVLEKISAEMTETAGEFSRQRIEAEGVKGALDNTINSASKLSAVVKGTTTILSGAGTLAMSWQMISTSIDAFKEASEGAISWGDAITQALMSIGMGLPMALGAIKNLNETFGITTGIIDGYNAKKQLSNQLDAASIPLIGQKVTGEQVLQASGLANLVVTDKLGDKEKELALATALRNGENSAALAILKGLNKEQLKKLGLDEAQIASLQKMTANQAAYNASAWANPYLLIGAAIVAAIAAIAFVTYKAVTAESAHEKQLKALQNSLEEQKETYDELAQKVDNLSSAFSTYKKIKAELDNCAEGTQEWTNKMEEAQTAARNLIREYTQLGNAGDLYKREGDMLVIDEDKVQAELDKYQNQLLVSEQTLVNTEVQAQRAALEKRKYDAQENSASWDDYGQIDGFWDGLGTTLSIIGSLGSTGTWLGSAMAYNAEEDKAFNELFKTIEEGNIQTDDEIREILSGLNLSEESLEEVIKEYHGIVEDTAAYESQKKNQYIGQVQQVYGADASYEDIQFGINTYDVAYEKALSDLATEGFITGDGIHKASGKDNAEYKDMLKQLSEATGQNYSAAVDTTNVVRGTDGNRKFVVNLNGEDIVLSKETVKQTIATGRALQALGKDATSASEALRFIQSAGGSGDKVDSAMGAALSSLLTNKDFSGLTKAQLEALKSATGDDQQFDWAELEKLGLTEDMVDDFGFESIDELVNAINSGLLYDTNHYKEDLLNDSLKNLFTDEEISGTGWGELTGQEKESFASQVNNIFKEVGTDAATVFSDLLTQGMVGFEDDLANFDYANASFEDFIELYRQNGVAIDETTEGAERLFNYLKNNATQALGQTTESFVALANSAKSLKLGETISEEEYKKYGDLAEEYFTKMADGTYMLTKDANAFYDAILGKSVELAEQNYEKKGQQLSTEQGYYDALLNVLEDGNHFISSKNTKSKYGEVNFETQRQDIADQLTWLLDVVGSYMTEEERKKIEEAISKGYAGEAIGGDAIAGIVQKYLKVGEGQGVFDTHFTNVEKEQKQEAKTVALLAKSWSDFDKVIAKYNLTAEDAQELQDARIATTLTEAGLTRTAFDMYVDSIMKSTGATEESRQSIERMASAQIALQSGITSLNSSWEEWKAVLDEGESNPQYFKTLGELADTLAKAFGVDSTLFTEDFIVQHLTDIGLAAEGDIPAIKRLQIELAKLKIDDLDLNIEGIEDEAGILKNILNEITSQDLALGANASISPQFKTQLEQMVLSSKETALAIASIFGTLGYGMEYTYKKSSASFRSKEAAQAYLDKHHKGFGEVFKQGNYWKVNTVTGVEFTKASEVDLSGLGDKGKDPDWATEEDKVDLARESQKEHWEHYDEQLRAATKELKAMEKQLSALAKQGEHLVGQDKIDNLNKQISLIKRQNAALEKQNERLRERAKLEARYLMLQYSKYGLMVDANTGELKNYSQVYQKLFNIMIAAQQALNDAIDRGIDKSTEDFKLLKAAADEAAEALNKFTSATSAFEEIFSSIEENNATIAEDLDEIIDKQIEAFNVKIEVEIDLHDFDQKMREFERTMNFKEGAFGSIVGIAQSKLEELGAMIGDGGILQKLTDHVNSLTGSQGVYGTHTKDYLDDLKEYATELIDNLEDAEELIDDIREAMVELMEEASEAFDTQISRYEALQATLEHDIKLLDLLDGEENNYAAKQAFYDKQNENYIAQLAFQKDQVAFWQKQMEMAEEGSEAYETAEENMRKAIESSQSTLEAAIESAQAAHINSIHAIFEELENQITGGKGLDQLTKEWELIKENADYYLDDVNEAYELSKLERNYRKAIDESDSVYAQRQINDMMSSELAMLKEKDKLTKYDIDRANLKYQLTLKQIALEDAQKNKSTMRLKRDKNGNYSYQYVADSSATSQLEQEIADLNNQIHNLDKEAYSSNLDQIRQVYQEWAEAMLEIENSGGTEEEKAEKRLAINKLYTERLQQLMTENQWMLMNLEQATIDSITGTWGNGVQDMVNAIQAEGGLEPVMNRVMSQITEATIAYQNTVTSMCEAAGKSLEELYGGFDKNIDILGDLITKNDDVITKYDEELGRMQTVLDTLKEMLIKYAEVRQAAIDAANAAYAQYQAVAHAALQGTTGNNSTYSDDTDWAWEMAKEFVKGNIWTDEATHRQTKITNNDGKDYGVDNPRLIRLFNAAAEGNEAAINLINEVAQRKKYFTDATLSAINFNTGGYTGAWANGDHDGRLAFLHQKELVLNSADTANLLKTIDVVRSLDMSLMSRMAGMLGQIGLRSLGAHTPESAPIEQNVHIDAHFPNVSSAQEIQEAFDQLADQLGQILYQNRK